MEIIRDYSYGVCEWMKKNFRCSREKIMWYVSYGIKKHLCYKKCCEIIVSLALSIIIITTAGCSMQKIERETKILETACTLEEQIASVYKILHIYDEMRHHLLSSGIYSIMYDNNGVAISFKDCNKKISKIEIYGNVGMWPVFMPTKTIAFHPIGNTFPVSILKHD